MDKGAAEGGHAFQDKQGDVYNMLLSEIATEGKTDSSELHGTLLNGWRNWLHLN